MKEKSFITMCAFKRSEKGMDFKMANKEAKTINKEKKSFFKGFKAELKKVVWPTPKQLVNNTVAVITIVLITAIIVAFLDFVFILMNKYGIDKIKEIITTNQTQESVSTDETTDNTVSQDNTVENSTQESNSVDEQNQTQNTENDEATTNNTES